MGMPPPEMAKTETLLMRCIRQFHDKFVDRLTGSTTDTLRCAAWQIDQYMEENKQYKDAEFLKGILAIIEFAAQQKGGTKWTVERAKRDMRGRTRGVNQFAEKKEATLPRRRVPISRDLARALADVAAKP